MSECFKIRKQGKGDYKRCRERERERVNVIDDKISVFTAVMACLGSVREL